MLIFDDEFKTLFLNKLQDLVNNGETISHHKSLESDTVIKNADDEIIRTSKTIKNERNTTLLPTPAWVMQMIEKNLSLEESIKVCQQAGYIVIDPSRVDSEDDKPVGGLSEFAVNEIRAKLLGIES